MIVVVIFFFFFFFLGWRCSWLAFRQTCKIRSFSHSFCEHPCVLQTFERLYLQMSSI
ncbi:hypothetical protein BDW42DRAFT_145633 [Aspergillus taichungensis]|uniref:Uncharacterized protein n=1 Tax=Aspergillus taichungensis TaxID=482145 RepID=A0A2J5HMN4_9EURO|nr:hypothetical protein BDW42DRAFT_145633 [Aspergillus taichungensis]